jgi:hypothetical protein
MKRTIRDLLSENEVCVADAGDLIIRYASGTVWCHWKIAMWAEKLE